MKKTITILMLILLITTSLFAFTGCSTQSFHGDILGTFLDMEVNSFRPQKVYDSVYDKIEKVEKTISPSVKYSDIYRINNAEPEEVIKVRQLTIDLLLIAKDVNKKSNGAFNPATFSLVDLWGFSPQTYVETDKKYQPPTDKQIAETLKYSNNFDLVVVNKENKTVYKKDSRIKIDLGGIAKGYCAKKAINVFKEFNVKYGFINLGGNVYVYNYSAKIGLSDPRYKENIKINNKEVLGALNLKDTSISTSGDYERCHIVDGIRYHHIIDPKTGKPANSGVIACSVINSNGALTDAVATSVVILGLENGEKLLNDYKMTAIIITNDYKYKVIGDLDFQYNDKLVKGYEKI